MVGDAVDTAHVEPRFQRPTSPISRENIYPDETNRESHISRMAQARTSTPVSAVFSAKRRNNGVDDMKNSVELIYHLLEPGSGRTD